MSDTNKNYGPQLDILNQYIKDLSFENPQSQKLIQSKNINNNVSFTINAFSQSYENNCIGVVLKITCNSTFEEQNLFHLELDYFGFFKILNNTKFEESIITNEAVRLLFPFARSIIANITQNGGSLPIFLDNIDFNLLKKANS